MRNNKKGFTLVELLAVIVVLAIVMGIAAVAITNVLDSTRRNAFVASARSYIAGAKTLVNADEVEIMLGGTAQYAPKCAKQADGSAPAPIDITLSKIRTEGGDNDKSPYGNAFDKTNSFVRVAATSTDNYMTCTYTYSIYLTDGVYELEAAEGTNAPATETALTGSLVAVKD